MTDHLVRTAWYGRVLLIGGAGLTVTTGVGLWGWPEAVGESFAWEIRAPLTASWMGAWYLAAAVALVRGALEPFWSRARIVLVVAFVLTTTSLLATVRFIDSFRLTDGGSVEQAIAWSWLAVYVVLPPVSLLVFVAHERAGGRDEYTIDVPLAVTTRIVLGVAAAVSGVFGLWLTIAPAALEDVWPWTINDLSAAILGTWAIMAAAGCAWALREGDWRRSRVLLLPIQVALVLLLVAAARFQETFSGGDLAIAVYVAFLAVALVAFTLAGIVQRRAPT